MKKIGWLLSLFFLGAGVEAQKIQYSRETFRSPFADAMQLVANIDGYHHVLCFTANKKPLVYIFTPQLQLHAKHELDFKLKEKSDVQLLAFKSFYLLYVHLPGTKNHQFFGVSGAGEVRDISDLFTNPADTAWNQSTATFQLFNVNNRLWLLTHTYFGPIKEIVSRIVSFTNDFKTVRVTTASFPFNSQTDLLEQVTLAGQSLLVLKTSRDDEKGNMLEVLKADTSGEVLATSFSSGSNLYINPGIRYDAVDSSVLVFSMLHESFGSLRGQRSVIVSELDNFLKEKTPLTVLKSQFRNNATASFLLVNTQRPYWLTMIGAPRIRRTLNPYSGSVFPEYYDNHFYIPSPGRRYAEPTFDYNIPSAVRFTSLNERFVPTKDSLVANDGSIYRIQPRPFARFQIKGKAYLLLIENFSNKQRGLFLASGNDNGELVTTSLPVFDRYEYFLPQLQSVRDEYFILPYSYKNEIGLVKITLTE